MTRALLFHPAFEIFIHKRGEGKLLNNRHTCDIGDGKIVNGEEKNLPGIVVWPAELSKKQKTKNKIESRGLEMETCLSPRKRFFGKGRLRERTRNDNRVFFFFGIPLVMKRRKEKRSTSSIFRPLVSSFRWFLNEREKSFFFLFSFVSRAIRRRAIYHLHACVFFVRLFIASWFMNERRKKCFADFMNEAKYSLPPHPINVWMNRDTAKCSSVIDKFFSTQRRGFSVR